MLANTPPHIYLLVHIEVLQQQPLVYVPTKALAYILRAN